jgi:hypothetical protein
MFESRLQTRHWSGRLSTRLVQQVANCSKHCRDAFVADAPKLQQEGSVTTYFEWLFLQPIENPQLKLKPALIRAEAQ